MKKENDRENNSIECPKCGFPISLSITNRLVPIKAPRRYLRPLEPSEQIVSRGNAAFETEASRRGWSVFGPLTPDVGIDYIIVKGYGAAMIQLKTSTLMDDGRYHVTVGKFLEGPLGFIIYHFQNIGVFFPIPSTKFWEIPRFKKLKLRIFNYGNYSDSMNYEKAKEVMGVYEDEKGWELLEQLTTPDGLFLAIKQFIKRQKKNSK